MSLSNALRRLFWRRLSVFTTLVTLSFQSVFATSCFDAFSNPPSDPIHKGSLQEFLKFEVINGWSSYGRFTGWVNRRIRTAKTESESAVRGFYQKTPWFFPVKAINHLGKMTALRMWHSHLGHRVAVNYDVVDGNRLRFAGMAREASFQGIKVSDGLPFNIRVVQNYSLRNQTLEVHFERKIGFDIFPHQYSLRLSAVDGPRTKTIETLVNLISEGVSTPGEFAREWISVLAPYRFQFREKFGGIDVPLTGIFTDVDALFVPSLERE